MTETTYQELIEDIQQLFATEAYAEAMEQATWGVKRFPDGAAMLHYLRACLAARMAQPERACQILDAALDEGLYYSEQIFRASPSFEPLQGLPVFEAVVDKGLALFEKHAEPPNPLTRFPEAGVAPHPLLLALHGNASSVKAESEPWSAVVPEGWVLGMTESSQYHLVGTYIWDDRERAVRDVTAYYESLRGDARIDWANVVLGGFSMGGQVALWLALNRLIPARGFVVLSPYIPDLDIWKPVVAQAPQDLRGVIIHVEGDETTEANHGALISRLSDRGIACKIDECPGGGHVYPPDFGARLLHNLDFVMRGTPL